MLVTVMDSHFLSSMHLCSYSQPLDFGPVQQGNKRPLPKSPSWLTVLYKDKVLCFVFKLLIPPAKQLLSDKITNLGKLQMLNVDTSLPHYWSKYVILKVFRWLLFRWLYRALNYWFYSCGWMSLITCCLLLVFLTLLKLRNLRLEIKLWLKKSCGPACRADTSKDISSALVPSSTSKVFGLQTSSEGPPTQGDKSSPL